MKEKKILLTSIEEAKRFVTEASRCDFDVDVFYNRFTIDAKSILGVSEVCYSISLYSYITITLSCQILFCLRVIHEFLMFFVYFIYFYLTALILSVIIANYISCFLENTFCSHLNTIRDNRNFRESFANVFVFFAPPLSAALRCIFPEYFCSAVQAGQLHNAYDQCSDGTYQKRRNSQHPV